jgi:hypothetical protein
MLAMPEIDPKSPWELGTELVPPTQFCASAPDAVNSEAAIAMPLAAAMPRPLRRGELADFPDSIVACPIGSARKQNVNMESPI